MGISVFNCHGVTAVVLRVDAGVIPDPDTIIADCEHEVETLRRLVPQESAWVTCRRVDGQRAARPR